MTKVVCIDPIEHAFLAAPDDQMFSGNQDGSRGVQVIIVFIQLKVVGGRKPVQQMQVRIEFDKALAELRRAVPTAVSGDEVDVALFVHRGRLTGLPDTGFLAAGRSIEDANLFEGGVVVTEQEAVIGVLVAMRGIAYENIAPGKDERRALVLHQRVKAESLDDSRTVRQIGSGG